MTKLHVIVKADKSDGGFIASVEDAPGVVGQGDTEFEAVRDALSAYHDATHSTKGGGDETHGVVDNPSA